MINGRPLTYIFDTPTDKRQTFNNVNMRQIFILFSADVGRN